MSFHALPWGQGRSLAGAGPIGEKYRQLFGEAFLDTEVTYSAGVLDSYFQPSASLDLAQHLAAEAFRAVELPIRFQPATIGAKSATITIVSNDPASPHTIAVSGHAPHGTRTVTGSACFGEVIFGTRVQQRLTFSHGGDCDLHITSVCFEGCRCPGCDTPTPSTRLKCRI
jgi:Orn/Lys/Arg decarboxylase, major domain